MAAAMGHQAKLGMAASSPATEAYDFISESLALTETLVDTSGFIGSRSHPSERVRQGTRFVQGSIVMHPSPLELDTLLPRILGTAESADVFAVAETIPSFFVTINRDIKVPSYSGCYVNRATFRGSEGLPLELTLDILGTDETVGAAGSFPAISISNATVPYMFHELVTVVNSVTYSVKSWELTVDNALESQFFNSQTPTRFNATDRIVSMSLQLPYGDATAAYGLTVTGVAVTATFTNGTVSILFSTPKVSFPRESATVASNRGELFLVINGIARKSGSTAEITVTSDSTV